MNTNIYIHCIPGYNGMYIGIINMKRIIDRYKDILID